MTEWFEQWFGEEYLHFYPHRDEEDAAHAVALVDQFAPLRGRRLLDLACGPGRHAVLFRRSGADVVGFDLSMPLLSRARHRANPELTVVRGDMRELPFAQGSFDIVVNLFTSFGYFSDDRQHELALHQVALVLKRSGIFVLDYFNSTGLADTLVAHEERAVGARRVIIDRRITEDGQFVLKEMHLLDDGRSFIERVRLFTADDLERLLELAGLGVRRRVGDYDGSDLTESSPRVIMIAECR